MQLIVVYDIATPDRHGEQRLRRVASICEGFGIRVQRSVFECRITDTAYEHFIHQLQNVIRPDTDRVTLYELNGDIRLRRTDLGKPSEFDSAGPWLL